MKYAKPIIDKTAYHQLIQRKISELLDNFIYAPCLDIANLEKVPRAISSVNAHQPIMTVQNALAMGTPTDYFQDIPIVIEQKAGDLRKGKSWVQKMANDYGYICGTIGADGDEMDCFLGPNHLSTSFFVVEQAFQGTKQFDEHKVMFGFNDINEAREAYMANYQQGWDGLMHIHEYPVDNFWEWYSKTRNYPQADLNQSFLNAISSTLQKALLDGTVVFQDGYLTGKFNAKIGLEIRKMGGTFNHTRNAYKISMDQMPADMKLTVSVGQQNIKNKVTAIYKHLSNLQKDDFFKQINFDAQYGGIILDLDKQFSTTIPKDLNIPVKMSPVMQKEMVKNYTNNLNLYINDWYDTAIVRLRKKVHDNVVEGNRASALISVIQAEKDVSYRKARFLAKQETSLFVSQYRESRYKEANVKRYKWSTSHDERVRPNFEARKTGHTANNHRKLNNRIFSWDDPPIVDSATGRRCHPGQDYGCRCVAIPILDDE